MKTIIKSIMVLIFVSQPVFASDESTTVKLFVKAFNDKNVQAMLNLASPDIKWMSVSDNSISTDASGGAELEKAMSSYFKGVPSAKSEIRHLNQSGNFVYALEEAFWSSKGVEKSQCSMAVYEFADGKIKHVWYYPAHKC